MWRDIPSAQSMYVGYHYEYSRYVLFDCKAHGSDAVVRLLIAH